MKDLNYKVNDIVEMKKAHPCTSRCKTFKILKTGADIKIECQGCGNIIIISRDSFNKNLKKIIKSE